MFLGIVNLTWCKGLKTYNAFKQLKLHCVDLLIIQYKCAIKLACNLGLSQSQLINGRWNVILEKS